jgi:hypothetical protein
MMCVCLLFQYVVSHEILRLVLLCKCCMNLNYLVSLCIVSFVLVVKLVYVNEKQLCLMHLILHIYKYILK